MRLYDYAREVLDNVNATWSDAGIVLPTLQYVAEGPSTSVSADCEQVVIALDTLTRGAPGAPTPGYTQIGLEWSLTLSILIWRDCVATSDSTRPPLAVNHETAAQETLGDLDLLWRNAKTLLSAEGCRHQGIVTAGLLGVEGVLGGSYLQTSVDLLLV